MPPRVRPVLQEQITMKTVLLSYLERNKVAHIPGDLKACSDLSYLDQEFRKLFLFEGNVSIHLSFQKFSPLWGDFVELEENEILNDKDKLKVIVSPRLVTPVNSSQSSTCTSGASGGPSASNGKVTSPLYRRRFHDDDDGDHDDSFGFNDDDSTSTSDSVFLPFSLQRPSLINATEPTSGHDNAKECSDAGDIESDIIHDYNPRQPNQYQHEIENHHDQLENENLKRKKLDVVKTKEDAVPLPYPFPLPKHFSSEVEVALNSKRLSSCTRRGFIAKVASAMLFYKRYPTSADYINVAQAVIQKYPFLRSPVGSPSVSIISISIILL